MAASGEFEGGSQKVPNAFKGPTVKVHHSAFNLTIRDNGRWPISVVELRLHPFDIRMLTPTNEEMKNGFSYSIKDTDVGTLMERETGSGAVPLSTHSIVAFCLQGQYTQESLTVKIECEAYTKHWPSPIDMSKAPWVFQVWFRVPKLEMKKFLCIADHDFARFEADLDACK